MPTYFGKGEMRYRKIILVNILKRLFPSQTRRMLTEMGA